MNLLKARGLINDLRYQRHTLLDVLAHVWGNIDAPLRHEQCTSFAETASYHLEQILGLLDQLGETLEGE